MKKSNKSDQEDKIPSFQVSVGAAGRYVAPSLGGKIISLNQKAESYFGVGPIWLTNTNYWCTIPNTLSNQEYDIIRAAISAGIVVLGKSFIPPVDKASDVPEQYWFALKEKGFEDKKVKEKFVKLLRIGQDQGWTTLEILQFCLNSEERYKKRKDVLRLLKESILKYDGPLQLYEPPDEEEGIRKVVINKNGEVIKHMVNGEVVNASVTTPPMPKGIVAGNRSSDDVLNEAFK